jgi:hypothetical protein
MDDWHRKLALVLGAPTPGDPGLDSLEGAAALEIALGRARSLVVYALELALAHRVPATGSVGGDDIWLRLTDARIRFTLNRREGVLTVVAPGADALRLHWDAARRAIVSEAGERVAVDLDALAKAGIDAVIATWSVGPGAAKRLSSPPPTFDDETTKG